MEGNSRVSLAIGVVCGKAPRAIYWGSMLVAVGVAVGAGGTRVEQEGVFWYPRQQLWPSGDGGYVLGGLTDRGESWGVVRV